MATVSKEEGSGAGAREAARGQKGLERVARDLKGLEGAGRGWKGLEGAAGAPQGQTRITG